MNTAAMPPPRCRTRGLRESASCASALPSARSRNRREEAAWAASAAPRMHVSGPMPNAASGLQLMVPALHPTHPTYRPFTSGCRRPEDQKVVCGVHAKPGSCKNCEAAAAGRHWRRPSAEHIGRWLAWGLPGGHLRRTCGMTPTHDCSTEHQAGLEWPVAARRRTRSRAPERRHRHGQHGGRQPEVRLGLGFGLASSKPNANPNPNPNPNQRQLGGAAAPACSCECAPRERHPTPHLGVAQLADPALLGAP